MNTMIFTIAMAILLQPTVEYEFPCPHHSMKCYPEVVMPGDSLYVFLEVKNPYDKPIYIDDIYRPMQGDIKIRIQDSNKESQPLLIEAFIFFLGNYSMSLAEINFGETRVIGALSLIIPPLENIHEPFWEKHLKDISRDGEDFLLQVSVFTRPCDFNISILTPDEFSDLLENCTIDRNCPFPLSREIVLEQKIRLKPRPIKEMAMIESWYDTMIKEFSSEKIERISSNWWKVIPVQNENYSQWLFIRHGNNYPGTPNTPLTWQGWKELEESITSSTMRDEIRLTRILIQYCDTKDKKVLDELKTWFAGMNEGSTTCMYGEIGSRQGE